MKNRKNNINKLQLGKITLTSLSDINQKSIEGGSAGGRACKPPVAGQSFIATCDGVVTCKQSVCVCNG